MSGRRPLAGFDDDIVEAVAGSTDLDRDTLRDLLVRLQRLVDDWESVGGADGLVYEWRTSFGSDPLTHQTGDAYYLDVSRRVWDDFDERMGLSPAECEALREAHARQFRRVVGSGGRNRPMVLFKPERTD